MSEIALIFSLFSVFLALFVVLVERKFLAYAQRRMGPAVMGRNGALQIALDLIKLLTKEIFLIPRPSSALAPLFLALLYAFQLMFSQNFIWGPSLFIFENVDSLILYHLILILFSNIFFLLVGLISQSRYAIIGTVRALVHIISLDIFVTILYSLLVFSSQSANFHDFVFTQNIYWFFFFIQPHCFSIRSYPSSRIKKNSFWSCRNRIRSCRRIRSWVQRSHVNDVFFSWILTFNNSVRSFYCFFLRRMVLFKNILIFTSYLFST